MYYGNLKNPLKVLIDTGSNKNFIHPRFTKVANDTEPFKVSSVGGDIDITKYSQGTFFYPLSNLNIIFYHMKELKTFDAIIGHDTLKSLKAIIDPAQERMIINNHEIKLLQHTFEANNIITIRDEHLDEVDKNKLKEILNKYQDLFQPPDEKLPFTTRIEAEIRTADDSPVYGKTYPYPLSLTDEVNKQVKKLLDDGIIRPSRSPYNSPVWIVPKKADASGEKKYRMVIDYRKLNSKTISDRYPIPDTTVVLANLGKSRYFTTLDLASGFHQIPLAQKDIEKTAFSVNNGKYEFVRMPFGLKNAPGIFQRVMDDVLREFIGKICHIYIDDIIIFSKTFEEHMEHIKIILETLRKANFRVQPDKSEFIKNEVEFLGFVVSKDGLHPNPKKIESIQKYPEPQNLKDLRAFLGLSGYYRRFVKNYADTAKPLTKLLRGEDGRRQIPKNQSKNHPITFDDEAKQAFQTLKDILSSDDVLAFPDFSKNFILTTDASNKALGAVLSQKFDEGERPITFISRTLTKTEENYATNEKEMLAVVWALHNLRNFIYGSSIEIYTDHLPLTFTLSPKNTNAKLKRWKAYLEEHDYVMKYKPGKSNYVADALSRVQINSLTITQHSADEDATAFIPSTESPVNVFRNQLIFKIGTQSSYETCVPFDGFRRHIFIEPQFTSDFLKHKLIKFLNPRRLNGIYTDEPTMAIIQTIYQTTFTSKTVRARFSQKFVTDIPEEEDQLEEIKRVHNYAHRNARENVLQILRHYFFPNMSRKTQKYVSLCEICKTEKYERHPPKYQPAKTPTPTGPGQIVHIDIFVYSQHYLFISSLDKFSKLLKMRSIKSKSVSDTKNILLEIIDDWGRPNQIVIDNESSFVTNVIQQAIRERGVEIIFRTPVNHSETNGQVERSHSTIREIARCLKQLNPTWSVNTLISMAVFKYNNCYHSFIKDTPKNIFQGDNYRNLPQDEFIEQRFKDQEKVRKIHQAKEENIPDTHYDTYEPDSYAFEKTKDKNKRISVYRRIQIKEDHNTHVIDSAGRKIHKTNLRKNNPSNNNNDNNLPNEENNDLPNDENNDYLLNEEINNDSLNEEDDT